MKRFIILCLVLQSTCKGTLIVQGNDTGAPFGFKTPVRSKVLDSDTGTFYVGIEEGADPNQSGSNALSKALRPTFNATPQFIGIALDQSTNPNVSIDLQNTTIEFLNIAPQSNGFPILPLIVQDTTGQFFQKKVFASSADGQNTKETAANLHDATGVSDTNGIIGIASSSSFVFAPVRPTGGDFGAANGGIALVEIDINVNNALVDLRTKDATTGLDGNKAVELQAASTVIDGGTTAVTFANGAADVNQVALHYDTQFGRLYIGVRIETGSALTDIGKAVVAGRLSTSGALLLEQIVANGAISGANEIVVGKGTGVVGTDLAIKLVRVMHTSTGPSYLIVNGGQGTSSQVGNLIQALPLVDNPNSPTTHGTLADKNQSLNNFKFVIPATTAGSLPILGEPASFVGGESLPIDPNDEVSDMVVVGDTVYVAINEPPTTTNDAGILYSQALYDTNGKIVRWTPWTKRGASFNAFPGKTLPGNIVHDGNVKFLDVDAKNGTLWVVEGDTQRVVGVTAWSTGATSTGLISQVSKSLFDGSFAVLDLDQATRGFTDTVNRYALFGGVEKVIFTRVSEAFSTGTITSPQIVLTDFSSPQNFLQTKCPGCVQVLEYSRTSTSDSLLNFFFAGTDKGLFVFTDPTGSGFTSFSLDTLNSPPFSTRSWQQIPTISGSVIDIKTSGADRTLYVLTFDSKTFSNTLFSIPFANTIGTMFAAGNIRTIGKTGIGVFAKIAQMYGIQILATGNPIGANPENKEQLILATNQGLFKSNANQAGANGIPDAATQTAANWTVIPGTNPIMFFGVAGIDTPIRHTVWPFSTHDESGANTFEKSQIRQISGTGNTAGTAANIDTFVPIEFNALNSPPGFQFFDPITYFFSDGTRRFFIINPTQDPATENKLMVSPYNTTEWNVGIPQVLSNPVLQQHERFYWVKQIGITGLLLAGTENGVVGLE